MKYWNPLLMQLLYSGGGVRPYDYSSILQWLTGNKDSVLIDKISPQKVDTPDVINVNCLLVDASLPSLVSTAFTAGDTVTTEGTSVVGTVSNGSATFTEGILYGIRINGALTFKGQEGSGLPYDVTGNEEHVTALGTITWTTSDGIKTYNGDDGFYVAVPQTAPYIPALSDGSGLAANGLPITNPPCDPSPQTNYVALGDSNTESSGDKYPEKVVGINYRLNAINEGVGGEGAAEMLARITTSVTLNYRSDMVNILTIWNGVNDFNEDDIPASISDIETIATTARTQGYTVVLMKYYMWQEQYGNDYPTFLTNYNAALQVMGDAQGFTVLDFVDQLNDPATGVLDDAYKLAVDNSHLNDAGQVIVAANVQTSLNSIMAPYVSAVAGESHLVHNGSEVSIIKNDARIVPTIDVSGTGTDADGRYSFDEDAAIDTWTKGGELGVEEATNGGFDTDTDWSKLGSWQIGGGVAFSTNETTWFYQGMGLVEGTVYQVSFELVSLSANFIRVGIGGSTTIWSDDFYTIGTKTFNLTAGAGGNLIFTGTVSNPFTGSIDNVSVKTIDGYLLTDDAEWLIESLVPTDEIFAHPTAHGSDVPPETDWNVGSLGSPAPTLSYNSSPWVSDGEYGDEELLNNSFDDTSGWTPATGLSITGGQAALTSDNTNFINMIQTATTIKPNTNYELTVDVAVNTITLGGSTYLRGADYNLVGSNVAITPGETGVLTFDITTGSTIATQQFFTYMRNAEPVGALLVLNSISLKEVVQSQGSFVPLDYAAYLAHANGLGNVFLQWEKYLLYSAEMATNFDFSDGYNGWNNNGGGTGSVAGDLLTIMTVSVGGSRSDTFATEVDAVYRVRISRLSATEPAGVRIVDSSSAVIAETDYTTGAAEFDFTFTATTVLTYVYLRHINTGVSVTDYASVKKVSEACVVNEQVTYDAFKEFTAIGYQKTLDWGNKETTDCGADDSPFPT